jgi:hypothetical protein
MGWWRFDDKKVQQYIDYYLKTNAQYMQNKMMYAANKARYDRHEQDPDDENRELAAAEHYLYARWQVGSGESSLAEMRIATVLYDTAKILGYSAYAYLPRKIIGYSYSRPSIDAVRWGLKGCSDGAQDLRFPIMRDPDADRK